MSVKVKHLFLNGYRDWKTVKIEDITLPEFTVHAVSAFLDKKYGEDAPPKSELKVTCKGQVINLMFEESGEQFILIG